LGPSAVAASAAVALGKLQQWVGFADPESNCTQNWRWATSKDASIILVNSSSQPITTSLSTGISADRAAQSLGISGPQFADDVHLVNGSGSWQRTITLPPGKSVIQFSFTGPAPRSPGDTRTLQFKLVNPTIGGPFQTPVMTWADKLEPSCKAG
jgi:hypothetical protein